MVIGTQALHKRMQAVPDRIRKEIKATLEGYAAQVVAEMKSLTPVESGELRDSIGWTWGDAPAGSFTVGSVRGGEYGKISITIYAGNKEAFYAHMQEFGTINMAANPFFFPVYRANKRRIMAGITRAVKKGMRAS